MRFALCVFVKGRYAWDMVDIELDRITFSYRRDDPEPLFGNFTLEIPAGEWVALVGPSGAGKTTLVKLMKGLLQARAGEVKINGSSLSPGELNRFAACVFANPENQIVSPLVGEDVAFGLENMGLEPETVERRREESLRAVGLWEKSSDFSHFLSGGEQQRLILAGALAMQKGCLLLDDPLSMLGAASRVSMLNLLAKIQRRESCTIVHITHLLEEAIYARRLVAIEAGRLVFDGTSKSFLQERDLVSQLGLELPAMTELGLRLEKSGLDPVESTTTLEQLLTILIPR
jgi:energy-coupling factor transport system ATP-binding protein